MATAPAGGILWIVPTPIGNLEDLTLRALRCLREADLIAAEDTRRTRILLSANGLPAGSRLVPLHANSPERARERLLDRVAAGKRVAYVTDAGMPGISDPGALLVREARGRALAVTVLPGPSAVDTAVVASGFAGRAWTFAGFLPVSGGERSGELARRLRSPDATVYFESPRRLGRLVAEIAALAPEREVCLARELTKVHEEVRVASAAAWAAELRDREVLGECVLVVAGAEAPPPAPFDAAAATERVAALRRAGARPREAVRQVAREMGAAANQVYRAANRGSG